jgi:hypothetical protein
MNPQPKPMPKLLEKQAKALSTRATDRAENAKAKQRAGGQCEVYVVPDGKNLYRRCLKPATETHHLLGGIGRRNKGQSILADYKLRVCATCHREITGHVLVPVQADHNALTVRYRRVS